MMSDDPAPPAPPASLVAHKVPFAKVCGLLERISRTRGVDAKRSLIRAFAAEWRQLHSETHGAAATTDSFFPVMRLLLPQCDKSRQAYGIKEHSLAKLYIEILCLGKDSPDSLKLLNYKSPRHARNSVGDFAEVVYFVLRDRCPAAGSLSVGDVNAALTEIAEGNAEKGAVRKAQIRASLLRLLRNTAPVEQKWLVRMLMKELKCGVSHASVLTAFHQDAEALFDVSQDLEKVCRQLHDPAKRLHEVEISLFSPFRPMLADRGFPARIEDQMGHKRFLLETKLDGERMQLHRDGDHFRFWSRNGFEWTDSFGADPYSGSLTPFIARAFAASARSCILDGEMMGFNLETGAMGSKAQEFDVKHAEVGARTGYVPCFVAFDLLLLNGEVLSNRPLLDRKRLLADCFTETPGRLLHSRWEEAGEAAAAAAALNAAVDGREEGVMAKRADSVYAVGSRKGGWLKLKPEYVGGLMDELDLLIVGGYFGSGHRAGMVSHFLLAVADETRQDELGHPARFRTVCKVGSGYSKQTLAEVNRRMAPHWVKWTAPGPDWLAVARERPDLWIAPKESAIVQVKAAEIVASDGFHVACTLRFPRVERFREDKGWTDAMTAGELAELREANAGKLAARHVDEWTEGGPPEPKKAKKGRAAPRARPAVDPRFLGIDAGQVERLADVLAGREVCVLAGERKRELEEAAVALGGAVVQNPGLGTFAVVADRLTAKVRNVVRAGRVDVLTADWLLRCREQKRLLAFRPADLLHATPPTQAQLARHFDKHGDAFLEPVADRAALEALLAGVETRAGAQEVREFVHEEAFEEEGPLHLACLYFDDKAVVGEPGTRLGGAPFDLVRVDAMRAGAEVTDRLEGQVSHVVVDAGWDASRVEQLQQENARRRRKFHVVEARWVEASIEAGEMKEEREFGV